MEVCFLEVKNSLPYVEIVVTTHCNLNCKDCANLISSYKHPYHIDINIIIKSIQVLLEIFDSIEVIGVLGGEPFLYPKLKNLIDYLCAEEKIGKIRLVTNGTIFISEHTFLQSLKNQKVCIQVNQYPQISQNKAFEICELLENNNIKYFYVDRSREKWKNFGDGVIVDKDIETLRKQFKNCDMKCRSILNGKMYYCPRSAHGNDLGIIKEISYVDLINDSISLEDRKKKINDLLFKNEYLEACRMCNAGTYLFTEIDAAVPKT